jgi:spermine oxidase
LERYLVATYLFQHVNSCTLILKFTCFATYVSGYLKQHQSDLFDPQLPEPKVKVINALKFGTTDKIFLEFEKPFWNETGMQFLWNGDELDSTTFDEKNWVHYVLGFDVVQNQPNMLVGWMAGLPAKY